MNMDSNKSSILGCLLVQRKSRLDTVTKAPNSMSCKMATVLKKKQENKYLIFIFVLFLSVEMFDIADFQGHFSYIS